MFVYLVLVCLVSELNKRRKVLSFPEIEKVR